MKRWWRIVTVRGYCQWRKEGRRLFLHTYWLVDKDGNIVSCFFKPNVFLNGYRRFQNRDIGNDKEWVEATRKWQIKGKLNYGRY